MAWEKVALDLARDAGIRVPDSQLIHIGDRNVLVVDRFDRQGTTRIGYASAMTMLEATDGDQRSYLEVAGVIDDHLQNHGFLHERSDSWALSPAFDLNPNPEPGPKELSTAIDFSDTRASIDTLMDVAEYFRLNAAEATDALAQTTRAVGCWRAVAASHGLQQADINAMEPAFEHAERRRAQVLTGNDPD